MKCQKCGNDIPDGELFCKECGAEVQLVPDYNTVDHLIQQQKNHHEQLLKEEQLLEKQINGLDKLDRKNRKKTILISMTVGMGIALLAFLIWFMIDYHHDNSYSYQMEEAAAAYNEGHYNLAMSYTDQALRLQPGDYDAQMMNVDIYMQMGNYTDAAHILKSMIYYEPDNIECYGRLISIYESQNKYGNIKALMDGCTSEVILDEYSEYICENPSFVTLGGTYKSKINVEIEAASGTIYYTTDGTIPTSGSQMYDGGIPLDEGTTTVMAIVYNNKGVSSDIISRDFTVVLAHPDPPEIVPASGTYEYGSKITVIVPEGCKAYFAFDAPADTTGKIYQEPVTMLSGEHIFNVILIDENGKQSYPASQTYVVE